MKVLLTTGVNAKYCITSPHFHKILFVLVVGIFNLLICSSVSYGQTLNAGVVVNPVCAGQNIQLTANVAGCPIQATYTWTGPDNFTSNAQNPQIMNVGTLASGVYTVNAFCGGVPTTPPMVLVNVTVNPLPNPGTIQVSLPQCTDLSPTITLSVNDETAQGVTYQWNFNGAPIGGATNATYNIPNNLANAGNYTLTATNACGGVTTAIQAINPNNFMFLIAGAGLDADNFITTYSQTPINLQFVFDGNFDFSCAQSQTALTFTNCTIFMGGGAQIIVGGNCNNAKTLTLSNTIVQECTMPWGNGQGGIRVLGDNTTAPLFSHRLVINNQCLIRGTASVGINIQNGGVLQASGSTLINHPQTHIAFGAINNELPLVAAQRMSLTGMVFDGGNFPNCVGLSTNAVTGFDVGNNIQQAGNRFQNMANAILINGPNNVNNTASIHRIWWNQFINISGSAIVARCITGAANNTTLTINNNTLNNVGTVDNAFAFDIAGYKRIQIFQNTGQNLFSAVRLRPFNGNTIQRELNGLIIRGNNFTFANIGCFIENRINSPMPGPPIPIFVVDLNSLALDLEAGGDPNNRYHLILARNQSFTQTIASNRFITQGVVGGNYTSNVIGTEVFGQQGCNLNYIDGNNFNPGTGFTTRSYTGIRCLADATNALAIQRGGLGLNINEFNQVHQGIDVRGSLGAIAIDENLILLNSTADPNVDIYGIHLQNPGIYRIRDNTIQGTQATLDSPTTNNYGTWIQNPISIPDGDLRRLNCNVVSFTQSNLYFDGGDQPGTSLPGALQISRNQMSNTTNALHQNNCFLASQGPFTSYTNQWLGGITNHIRSNNSNGGLSVIRLFGGLGTPTNPSGFIINHTGTPPVPIAPTSPLAAVLPCLGNGIGINLVGGGSGGGAEAQNAMTEETTETQEAAPEIETAVGPFAGTMVYMRRGYEYDAYSANPSLLSDAAAQSVYESLTLTNIPVFRQIETLLNAGIQYPPLPDSLVNWATEIATGETAVDPSPAYLPPYQDPDKLNKALELLNGVSPQNEIEKYLYIGYKSFCRVFLGETLSDGEKADLETVAQKCVFPYGIGPLYARHLLSYLNGAPYLVEENCNDAPENFARVAQTLPKTKVQSVALKLYPNPAKGNVTIENVTDGTMVEIYDARGAKIDTRALTTGLNRLPLVGLRSGVYLFRFLNGIETIATQKVQVLE